MANLVFRERKGCQMNMMNQIHLRTSCVAECFKSVGAADTYSYRHVVLNDRLGHANDLNRL